MINWSWVGEWDPTSPRYGKSVSRAYVHPDGMADMVTVTQDVTVKYGEKWYVTVDGLSPRLLHGCQCWDDALCLAVGYVEWDVQFRKDNS